jgi:cell division protein FtsB
METEKKRNFLQQIQHRADRWVENTASRFSPLGRVLFVLILGGGLFVFSTYFILDSMYNLGVRAATRELLQQQEAENQELQQENDKSTIKNYEYE